MGGYNNVDAICDMCDLIIGKPGKVVENKDAIIQNKQEEADFYKKKYERMVDKYNELVVDSNNSIDKIETLQEKIKEKSVKVKEKAVYVNSKTGLIIEGEQWQKYNKLNNFLDEKYTDQIISYLAIGVLLDRIAEDNNITSKEGKAFFGQVFLEKFYEKAEKIKDIVSEMRTSHSVLFGSQDGAPGIQDRDALVLITKKLGEYLGDGKMKEVLDTLYLPVHPDIEQEISGKTLKNNQLGSDEREKILEINSRFFNVDILDDKKTVSAENQARSFWERSGYQDKEENFKDDNISTFNKGLQVPVNFHVDVEMQQHIKGTSLYNMK
jgi:hypothetical protein